MKKLSLYCDGAARGNPGPAAYGFVIREGEEIVDEGGEKLGIATNNVAEYKGLIEGLKRCQTLKADHVDAFADSELMVKQIKGQYKVRSPHLLPLFKEARALFQSFGSAEIAHVRRELNKEADALANKALDNSF